ncbi:Delta-1-pyrroline-5-carboxylate dehydrogenase, mitochondrial [Xenotaenia resolanae]|uniref:Delta-1-pyrroline-5-carboxylate dehydrogenase, mitochondrial n=1 Tax=Xenotaenia resolanae TaxID=208358 RepID=A0ABV0WKH2_9TELE
MMLRVRVLLGRSWRGFKTWPSAAVEVKNEPILGFQKGSPERAELQKALDSLKGKTEEIPCVVGDEHVWTKDLRYQLSPFNHSHKVAKFCYADKVSSHDPGPEQNTCRTVMSSQRRLSSPVIRRSKILSMMRENQSVHRCSINPE